MFALNINHLEKTYSKGPHAVNNLDLQVKPGDFFALLGPNGAGKSTTIGIISQLINKDSGTVEVFGVDLDNEPQLAKTKIGIVPQEFNFNIFEKTFDILVNQAGYYGIPYKEAKVNAEYFLKKLGLWEKAKVPARFLSGGMKRRLLIARGMVHKPKLLILDEPTAGVDIELRRTMWGFLQEINQQGTTIILTTHYLEEAESLCKNVAIINHGKIIANTTIKELIQKLNIETLVLDLKQPFDQNIKLADFEVKLTDDPYSIEVSYTKEQTVNQLINEFTKHNFEIISLRNKVNRLEELFMRLTKSEE